MGLGKIYFFILGPNFFLGPCDSISNSILKFGAILTFSYISLVYFVSSNFSVYFKFELQVHGIMDFGHPKIDTHDI